MSTKIQIIERISSISAIEWDALTDGSPLTSHAFLLALETSKSVQSNTGWQPYHIAVYENEQLVGAMPQYLKTHSYGEYVFDWAWANAYSQNGLDYYPKLLSAVPFSPITGSRMLAKTPKIQSLMIQIIEQQLNALNLSSAHILFPDEAAEKLLIKSDWLQRHGVQFRWENKTIDDAYFTDFEHFLSTLAHDKRKKIRQERKKINAANIVCKQLTGSEISEKDWEFFYECYCNTYFEHRSKPYLTREFFNLIGKNLSQNILLIIAEIDNKPIAASLCLFDQTNLYGRYWGALQYVPNLHFELCYYQAQVFCIAQKIRYFEGGAQGEHKLARGFKPRPTTSFHKIVHPQFKHAIEQFLVQEQLGMAQYVTELEDRAPFKA